MKLYIEFLKKAFQKNIAYKTNIYVKLIGKIIFLFIQLSLWKALYESHQGSSTVNSIAFTEMTSYVIISNTIFAIMSTRIVDLINHKIRTGEIAIDLMRPFNFKLYVLMEVFSENLLNILFHAFPLILTGLLLFKISVAGTGSFLWFLFAIANGFIINFLIAFIIGIAAFWFITTWPLNMLMDSLIFMLSGVWIPIWFFPGSIKLLMAFLPFQYIYFVPLAIYHNQLDGLPHEYILRQLIWIIILFCLERILWHIGNKKLIIQGG